MPRAHLSKRLPDAEAIRLFAEHHITQVRRRKNGEILAVKHATFGWISPQQYYGMQKLHDLIPVLGPFIQGGYALKLALVNSNISIANVNVPIGVSIYGAVIGECVPIALSKPKDTDTPEERVLAQRIIDWARFCLAMLALPYGDLLLPYAYVQFQAAQAGVITASPWAFLTAFVPEQVKGVL